MRTGNWFTTHSGKKFYPLDPRPEDICIEDIAHSLSHVCRYGGHCAAHYSVAQHSVYVSLVVGEREPEHALWGLLHDAAEAYVGDMVRPLKQVKGMGAYRDIEAGIMIAICKVFGLPLEEPAIVKEVDRRMCVTEGPWMFPGRHDVLWSETVPPIAREEWPARDNSGMLPSGGGWHFWRPHFAKHHFIRRFGELT
jgi:uncharacterized protein